jgi:hypothetical protein
MKSTTVRAKEGDYAQDHGIAAAYPLAVPCCSGTAWFPRTRAWPERLTEFLQGPAPAGRMPRRQGGVKRPFDNHLEGSSIERYSKVA